MKYNWKLERVVKVTNMADDVYVGDSACKITVSVQEESNLALGNPPQKLNHKKWRSKLKMMKRKVKRQEEAQWRAEIEAECEDAEIEENSDDEECLRAKLLEERNRLCQHLLWIERERMAQGEFLAKKQREEKERQRQEEEERRIKEEWEERQRKEKEEQEQRNKENEEKKSRQDELLKEATANERKAGTADGSWHNPLAPVGYNPDGQERPECPFYSKVGACRFRDRCSRNHIVPDDSCTLLFPGMYSHFELEQRMHDEYDTDLTLEFEDSDIYQHFESFYNDVLPEFKAVGQVVQFKVCCNYEPHLRGNVYVQYTSREYALDAYAKFNGRFYAGRQLSCQFTGVTNWKRAICGLYHIRKCPKGPRCNFLHVFRNPFNEFHEADLNLLPRSEDYMLSSRRGDRSERRSPYDRNYESQRSHRSHMRRSRSRSQSRSSKRRKPTTNHRSPSRSSHRRSHRSRSSSRNGHKSRSRSRSHSRRRSRSQSPSNNKSRYHSHREQDHRSSSRSTRRHNTRSSQSSHRIHKGDQSSKRKIKIPVAGSQSERTEQSKADVNSRNTPTSSSVRQSRESQESSGSRSGSEVPGSPTPSSPVELGNGLETDARIIPLTPSSELRGTETIDRPQRSKTVEDSSAESSKDSDVDAENDSDKGSNINVGEVNDCESRSETNACIASGNLRTESNVRGDNDSRSGQNETRRLQPLHFLKMSTESDSRIMSAAVTDNDARSAAVDSLTPSSDDDVDVTEMQDEKHQPVVTDNKKTSHHKKKKSSRKHKKRRS